MAVSASGQGGMLLRVDPAQTEELVKAPHARRFEMRGREMDGWLRVDPGALATDADLARWVSLGVTYARTLPAQVGRRRYGTTASPEGTRAWAGVA